MFYRSLKTRITLLFVLLTLVTVLILFGASYLFLEQALIQDSLEEVKSILLNMWAQYEAGGLELLAREISFHRFTDRAYLVRVADRDNRTLLFFLPGSWQGHDSSELEAYLSVHMKGVQYIQWEGMKFTVISIKLSDGQILQAGIGTNYIETFLFHYRQIYLLALLPILILTIAVSFLFSQRLAKPINKLIEAAERIVKTGDTATRIHSRDRGDEVSKLVVLFNMMLERLDSSMERMRDAMDTVAHDLRTPMTRLKSSAEIALQSGDSGEVYRNALKDCIENSDTILTMLKSLMDISEAETGALELQREKTDISSLVNDIADLYTYVAEEKGVAILQKLEGGIEASIDKNRIRQAIANLLDNAIKYTQKGGKVTLKTYRKRLEDKDFIIIEVADTGIGIPKEDFDKIWQRLYRGKNTTHLKGLGLGLSFVRAIIDAHGGFVNVRSKVGGGSVFSVFLPVT